MKSALMAPPPPPLWTSPDFCRGELNDESPYLSFVKGSISFPKLGCCFRGELNDPLPILHNFRDCFCYFLCIVILLCTIANSVISWYEALFLILSYILYCIAMSFNSKIEAWCVSSLPVPSSWKTPNGDNGR